MARKQQPEEWISSREARELLSQVNGREISADYVRLLGNSGRVATKPIDGRTKFYLKSDIEAYRVKQRGTGEVRRAARTPKREKSVA